MLRDFYRLQVLTRRRHQLPPQPLTWFRNLAAHFGNAVSIRVAYIDGRPIAGILALQHKKTVTFKYGCSNATFHNLGAVPFLMWDLIRDSTERGYDLLDLGRSSPNNIGLIRFKERLGAMQTDLTYWRTPHTIRATGIEGPQRVLPSWVSERVPDELLILIGRALYKHFA